MDVRIRELKANLSKYVRRAARGEQIIVTDRGKPVAKLVGLGTSMLERGIAEGWIRPPARSGLTPAVYYKASLGTMKVIDEDRGGGLPREARCRTEARRPSDDSSFAGTDRP